MLSFPTRDFLPETSRTIGLTHPSNSTSFLLYSPPHISLPCLEIRGRRVLGARKYHSRKSSARRETRVWESARLWRLFYSSPRCFARTPIKAILTVLTPNNSFLFKITLLLRRTLSPLRLLSLSQYSTTLSPVFSHS